MDTRMDWETLWSGKPKVVTLSRYTPPRLLIQRDRWSKPALSFENVTSILGVKRSLADTDFPASPARRHKGFLQAANRFHDMRAVSSVGSNSKRSSLRSGSKRSSIRALEPIHLQQHMPVDLRTSYRSTRRNAFTGAFAPIFQQEAIAEAGHQYGAAPGGFGPRATRTQLSGLKAMPGGDLGQLQRRGAAPNQALQGMETPNPSSLSILSSTLQKDFSQEEGEESSTEQMSEDLEGLDVDEDIALQMAPRISSMASSKASAASRETPVRRLSKLMGAQAGKQNEKPLEEHVTLYLNSGRPWYIRVRLETRAADALQNFITTRRPILPATGILATRELDTEEEESSRKPSKEVVVDTHRSSRRVSARKRPSHTPEQLLKLERIFDWLRALTIGKSIDELLVARHPLSRICCFRYFCHSDHTDAKWHGQGAFFGTVHVLLPAAVCAFFSYAQKHFAWAAVLPGSGEGGIMVLALARAGAVVFLEIFIVVLFYLVSRYRVVVRALSIIVAGGSVLWLTAFSVLAHDGQQIANSTFALETPYVETDGDESLVTIETFVAPSALGLILGPGIVLPIMRLTQVQLLIYFSDNRMVRYLASF
eukprot:gnl/MRDRNA2_/MRDRNA2_36429_c0_seq2.p1 gnl/MRDRNA2_/MRDRNA2_36429_c0~~gnl/MRDRNA2_/MRDRNA2_36429_c0_seq2.p1  ORF type:complete len:650 (-),score=71.19 gnl/MRDRNA2_/MRDRNA2_36429_c0_seq2:86-1870(-)